MSFKNNRFAANKNYPSSSKYEITKKKKGIIQSILEKLGVSQ